MKRFYFFLIFSLIFFSYQTSAQVEPKDTDGDGYRNVSTLDHLRWISENSSAWSLNYELDNDINAADTKNWNDGLGWSPIGKDSLYSYRGLFNGQGFKIDSLFINRPKQNYIGLFGYISQKASILNLGLKYCIIEGNWDVGSFVGLCKNGRLENCSTLYSEVTGYERVGGLVGVNDGGRIFDCSAIGIVKGISDYTGGLVGINSGVILKSYTKGQVDGTGYTGGLIGDTGGSVCDCFTNCTVIGTFYTGGLVGHYPSGIIINSYSTGDVTGSQSVGGFVGHNFAGIINNCYSTGNVVANSYAGGLVGFSDQGTVYNSYSIGTVTASSDFGGLVGYSWKGSVIASFWDIQSSGILISRGGEGKTTKEMKTKSTFIDSTWNFDFIWEINDSYPIININMSYRVIDTDNDNFLNIKTLNDLRWFSESGYDIYKNWELDNRINASTSKKWNCNAGYFPIRSFSGKFEGHGYTIDSLYINRPFHNDIGLFGDIISSSEITNVGLTNCYIVGQNATGPIVGSLESNCIVKNCFSDGSVKGNELVGGIVGINKQGTVTKCFSKSFVEGNENIGVLVGYNDSYSHIDNCFCLGNASGNDHIGGLVGYNYYGYVINCYSTGTAKGVYNVGPLIGDNFGSASKCFWDMETSGISASRNGTGKTTKEMKTKSTFTDSTWNFVDIWKIDPEVNEGYPYLFDMPTKVKEIAKDTTQVLIYPNPAGDFITVALKPSAGFEPSEGSEVSIYNTIGEKVMSVGTGRGLSARINISDLPKGMYFVRIGNEVAKFVKI